MRPREAARALGVCRDTLRNWEKRGLVQPIRDRNGVRHYSEAQVAELRRFHYPHGAPVEDDGEPRQEGTEA